MVPLLALVLAAAPSQPAQPSLRSFVVEGETGPAYVFQNDNRYGATGTKYTAREIGQQRNLIIAKRIALEAGLGERHTAILLWAPFDVTTRVTLSRDLDFRGQVFQSGEVVDHRYLFDGYRASYLYRVLQRETLRLDLGASVQIRNASVELRSVDGEQFAVEHDVGTVAALKARLHYRPSASVWTTLEADALSSFGIFRTFSGGIYDVSLSLGTPLGEDVDGFVRLRWLGGGANVPKRDLENWGNFFFATAGARGDLVGLFRRDE